MLRSVKFFFPPATSFHIYFRPSSQLLKYPVRPISHTFAAMAPASPKPVGEQCEMPSKNLFTTRDSSAAESRANVPKPKPAARDVETSKTNPHHDYECECGEARFEQSRLPARK